MEKQQKVMIYSWLLLAVVLLTKSANARPLQNTLSITPSSVDAGDTSETLKRASEEDHHTDEVEASDAGNLSGGTPVNLSGNVVTPMNLSGDSAGMLWDEIFRSLQSSASRPTNLSGDIANPLNLSGESKGTLREEILRSLQDPAFASVDLSGNVVNPLNLSGDSIGPLQKEILRSLQNSARPMNLSGDIGNPQNLTGDSAGKLFEEINRHPPSMRLHSNVARPKNFSEDSTDRMLVAELMKILLNSVPTTDLGDLEDSDTVTPSDPSNFGGENLQNSNP